MLEIYLAGAMEIYGESGYAKEWRNKVVEYFKEFCTTVHCVNPVDYYSFTRNIAKCSSEIMRFDLRKVKEADVILVNLKDVRKSLGTSDEILYGFILGKPIIGFIEEDFTDEGVEQYIHSWKYEQIDRIETGKNAMLEACEYIKNYYCMT